MPDAGETAIAVTGRPVAGSIPTRKCLNGSKQRGAWRCGKRSAFPSSPHPRRLLRTNFKRSATLTIYLVQKIGQVKWTVQMTTQIIELPNVPVELTLEFFGVFARFEYALRRSR